MELQKRTIKFRAWDKSKKLIMNVELWDFKRGCDLRGNDGKGYYSDDGNLEFMQFTGLTDKNGKEIYEGDLFKPDSLVKPFCLAVKYDENNACFEPFGNARDSFVSQLGLVIGNIFENPELLS